MICINLLGGPIFILLLSSESVAGLPHHHFRGRAPQTCPPVVRMTNLCEQDSWDTSKQLPSTASFLSLAYRSSSKIPPETLDIFSKPKGNTSKNICISPDECSSSENFLQATPTFTESGQCAAASSDKPALDPRGLKSRKPTGWLVGWSLKDHHQGLGPSKTFCCSQHRRPMLADG